MTSSGGFLSRWAQRKAEARKAEQQEPGAVQASAPAPATEAQDPASGMEGAPKPDIAAVPEFDLSCLPSIESLTAASDLTPFMQIGVPEWLKNAALRKMWVTDPGIRDYIGLADYDWDFNTPGALAGHGELAAGTDVAKLVQQFTNAMPEITPVEELPEFVGQAPLQAPLAEQPVAFSREAPPNPPEAASERDDSVQDEDFSPAPPPPIRRRHGGGVPR